MIILNEKKIQIICKIYSPDGSSTYCKKCPLGNYCGASLPCLTSDDWKEVTSILDDFTIPSYADVFTTLYENTVIKPDNIMARTLPRDVFGDVVEHKNTLWATPVSIEFLNKLYPENEE